MSFPFGVDNFNYSPNQKYFLDSSSDDQPTAVLLICIYNKYSTLITHDIIYKAFSEYGEIFKVCFPFFHFIFHIPMQIM